MATRTMSNTIKFSCANGTCSIVYVTCAFCGVLYRGLVVVRAGMSKPRTASWSAVSTIITHISRLTLQSSLFLSFVCLVFFLFFFFWGGGRFLGNELLHCVCHYASIVSIRFEDDEDSREVNTFFISKRKYISWQRVFTDIGVSLQYVIRGN